MFRILNKMPNLSAVMRPRLLLTKQFNLKYFATTKNSSDGFKQEYIKIEKPLFFRNGLTLVYNSKIYDKYRYYYFGLCLVTGYICYKLVQKTYQSLTNKQLFRAVFWGLLSVYFLKKGRNLTQLYNQVIKKIELAKDGKHILITYGDCGFFQGTKFINIAQISKAQGDISIIANNSFPIMMKNRIYYIPKDNEDVDEVLLHAIIHNKYIQFGRNCYQEEVVYK